MPLRSLRGRGGLPLSADINVTSLVDVAFVLLIIFMITAPIMQGGIDVQLPRGEARPIQPREGITISIDQDGGIFLDEDRTPISYEDFRATFQAIVSSQDPEGVYIRGDGRARYRDVIRVVAVVQAAGIDNVGIVLADEEIVR